MSYHDKLLRKMVNDMLIEREAFNHTMLITHLKPFDKWCYETSKKLALKYVLKNKVHLIIIPGTEPQSNRYVEKCGIEIYGIPYWQPF